MNANVLMKLASVSSVELVSLIKESIRPGAEAVVIGAGPIGREYVNVLRMLGVSSIHVCARQERSLVLLKGTPGVHVHAGGYQNFNAASAKNAFGVIATAVDDLPAALEWMLKTGFKTILCEKPISLWSSQINRLGELAVNQKADVYCAFNRMAYPSLIEARRRIHQEGGMTSCIYTFTEFIDRLKPETYAKDVQERWGVANSLHVISMAHRFIGLPQSHTGFRRGELSWHPTGSVFVGAGLSELGIPFAYQADWGSTGRWSIELHTAKASYRLCPLESLYIRTSATSDWEPVMIEKFSATTKPGYLEQTAALLNPDLRSTIPICPIAEAAKLVRFAEDIFGYARQKCS